MKIKLRYLRISSAAALLLAGCRTAHVTQWEYKVVSAPRWRSGMSPSQLHEAQQEFLNGLGKDGWALVNQEQGAVFYLKRPIR